MTAAPEPEQGEPLRDVNRFAVELGLEEGFFRSLLEEDDWSFVIKLHALVEAAVAHLLAETCGRPELLPVFSRMAMGGSRTGKLAFGKVLDCLDDYDLAFIAALSEVRNRMVHSVRDAALTLDQYVAELDKGQFETFRRRVGPADDPLTLGKDSVPAAVFVRENPKLCLWLRAMYTIGLGYHKHMSAKARRELTEASVSAAHAKAKLEAARRELERRKSEGPPQQS